MVPYGLNTLLNIPVWFGTYQLDGGTQHLVKFGTPTENTPGTGTSNRMCPWKVGFLVVPEDQKEEVEVNPLVWNSPAIRAVFRKLVAVTTCSRSWREYVIHAFPWQDNYTSETSEMNALRRGAPLRKNGE